MNSSKEKGMFSQNESYAQFRNVWAILYKTRLVIGFTFCLWIVFQLLLIQTKLHGYFSSWTVTLIPTYMILTLAFGMQVFITTMSKMRWFSYENITTFVSLIGFTILIILVTVKLETPDSMDYFAALLPSTIIFLIITLSYLVRIVSGLETETIEYTGGNYERFKSDLEV